VFPALAATGFEKMLVYKYLHPDRIDVLKNGVIRFTQASALNDPFESRPILGGFRESIEKAVRNASGGILTPDTLYTIQEAISETFGRLNEDNPSGLVFLSLTKNRNNLLMWSHYCDTFRGFVVGFDADDPFFCVERRGSKSVLECVVYSASRPNLPALDEDIEEFLRNKRSIMTKSHHWAYEEELRMCASAMAADVTKPGCDGQAIYLFKFPAESVKEIILGYMMPAKDRATIAQIISETYANAELYVTELNESKYDLDIVPYRANF
jgi:hypothetical protein